MARFKDLREREADEALHRALSWRKRAALADKAKKSPVYFHLHAAALHATYLYGVANTEALGIARLVEGRLYRPGLACRLRRIWARLVCLFIGHLAYTLSVDWYDGCGDQCGEYKSRHEACAACGKSSEYKHDRPRPLRQRFKWARVSKVSTVLPPSKHATLELEHKVAEDLGFRDLLKGSANDRDYVPPWETPEYKLREDAMRRKFRGASANAQRRRGS